jgi:hypothetical protein
MFTVFIGSPHELSSFSLVYIVKARKASASGSSPSYEVD